MKLSRRRKRLLYPWICWLIVAVIYLFAYGLLAMPSVISDELKSVLNVDQTGIGILYSAFLYTYVLMQIPVGYLYDRYRCRNLLFLASMFMVLGCLIFVMAHSLWVGLLGRMVMGFGGSFAFIGALYLGRSWFPVALFPLIVGLTEAMSGLSEITLLPLMAFLKKFQHWEVITLEYACVLLGLAVLVFFFVRERHPQRKIQGKMLGSDLGLVFKNKTMWLLSLYVGFSFAFNMVIANMWGVPLLMAAYDIPSWIAAIESGLIMMGFTVGCFVIGWLGRLLSDRLLMLVLALVQFVAQIILWYFTLDLVEVGVVLFIIGFASSSIVLAFDFAKKVIPESSYGLAAGFINMFFGASGILISPLVGYIFQVTESVSSALVPVMVCSGVAMVVAIFLKEIKIKLLPVGEQGGV